MAHERPRFQGLPNNGLPPPERGGNRFGVITKDRPGTRTPILPGKAPLPPEQPLAQTVLETIFKESGRTTEKPTKTRKNRKLIVGSAIAAGLALAGAWGLNKVLSDDEPTPQATPQTRSVDFFPNSFNSKSPVLVETKKVNPNEVFDPSAREETISDKNTIKEMSLEEYRKIAPPTIDRKTPEKINIGFSIENADGSDSIGKVIVKKRPDYIGGGMRTTDFRIDSQTQKPMYDGQVLVSSNFIFKEGLEDKTVSLIIKDAKKVTIENMSEENTQNLKRGGFHVKIENNNGDFAVFIIGTTGIDLAQHLPPARTESLGGGQWKLVSTPVTIESNEGITIVPLGRIATSSKQNFNSGVLSQMSMISVSTVTDKNDLKQVGPAEIMLTTSDGKFINPKVN